MAQEFKIEEETWSYGVSDDKGVKYILDFFYGA